MIRQKRSLMVLLLVLALAMSACQVQATATPQQSSTATVSRGSLQAAVSAAGTIAAQAQVSVQFQNSGTVKAVNVKVGDQVKAGQVMATLNTTDLEAAVASAQAGLDMAQAPPFRRRDARGVACIGSPPSVGEFFRAGWT